MSINYQYNDSAGYVLTKVTSIVSLEKVAEYIETLVADSTINKPFYEIVDFSNISNFDFGYYESDILMDLIIKLSNDKQYIGSLLVANKDITKGMSNIFKVIGEDKGIEIKIFNTVNDAINYVAEKSA